MNRSNSKLFRNGFSLVALLAFASTAQAVINHADDVNVQGNFCAGAADCTGTPAEDIVIKDTAPAINFDDTQAANGDYQLQANSDDFRIRWLPDVGSSHSIFTIEDGAIANSMYIDSAGLIGIGEDNPAASLHITKAGAPGLMLEGEITGSQVAIYNAFEGAFAIQTDPDGASKSERNSDYPIKK